jgi:leader peptidase (prepilin peptidase) / N-methyltransferase
MIRIFITAFAALAGLAFGSFLNVCLSRWPQGESIVQPRSHCRTCNRTLTWWENIPLASWLALRGHCRTCKSAISWRYPAVELLVGILWGVTLWRIVPDLLSPNLSITEEPLVFGCTSGLDVAVGKLVFYWLLIALAFLDAENLWLPNWLTLPGIALGIVVYCVHFTCLDRLSEGPSISYSGIITTSIVMKIVEAFLAALLILAIRWVYWLVRRREGIGLGDAKLMALLAAWLGLPGALLSFAIGVILGSVVGVVVLVRSPREGAESPALAKLPLGTFLCIGGIVSSLWGQPIIAAYMRYAGLN